ncbi:AAA family ATPase [Bacteroidales bacterium OttesenSCG-928-I21]|nr:AAA family ATPase [Bacteroidales bacterium OttesenSCG-928-I21]
MFKNFFYDLILKKLEHSPTLGQAEASKILNIFFESKDIYSVFLLAGYAGTGKTTLISALINVLDEIKIKTVLLAPTGRAAKVLSSYSGKNASTIHKCIYRKKSTKSANSNFDINFNAHKDTVFIVDEASMIGNINQGGIFGSGRLLDDLLNFVFNGSNCRIILLGDTAQLPPVGSSISPALDKKYLEALDMNVFAVELSEVVRQSADSGILHNATMIRENINSGNFELPKFEFADYCDVIAISGTEMLEEIENCYSKYGVEETKIICKTNKYASKYNQGIRNRILWKEEEISTGDLLMVVKNNYSWLPENCEIDFVANGDVVEVVRVGRETELYGHRFIDLLVKFVDFPNLEIEVKVLLDSINIESAGMNSEYYKKLYNELLIDYEHITDSKKRHETILNDPYFNALQVKYAYALTCHKAQGGQWKAVFVDHGWLNTEAWNEEIKYEFLRWLYTAVTRATEKLYLVNFIGM